MYTAVVMLIVGEKMVRRFARFDLIRPCKLSGLVLGCDGVVADVLLPLRLCWPEILLL